MKKRKKNTAFWLLFVFAICLLPHSLYAQFEMVSSSPQKLILSYSPTGDSAKKSIVFVTPQAAAYTITASTFDGKVIAPTFWESHDVGKYRGYALANIIITTDLEDVKFTVSFLANNYMSAAECSDKEVLKGVACNWQSALLWDMASPAIPIKKAAPALPIEYKFVLQVAADGIYRVYGRDLEDAGASLADLNVFLPSLQLYNCNNEVPIFLSGEADGVFSSDDYFEFYGTYQRHDGVASDRYYNAYSNKNAYLLTWGMASSGARMVEENGALMQTNRDSIKISNRYLYIFHLEQNSVFHRLGEHSGKGVRDHWFWMMVNANSKKSIEFDLPEPADGYELDMDLVVMLSGSHSNPSINHVASLWFNDQRAGVDAVWSGQEWYRAEASFSNLQFGKTLKKTNNVLEIAYETPQTNTSPSIMLNWVEARYWRKYRAYDNYIEFNRRHDMSDGLFEFSIDGFSSRDIQIYKIGKSKITYAQVELADSKNGAGYKAVFQDYLADNEVTYVALTEDRIRKPLSITPYTRIVNHTGADYIIITHPDFEDAAQELHAFRSSDYTVYTADINAIYNSYNHGNASPHAIKAFLTEAYQTWEPAPKYVVLLGDGAWDHGKHYDTNVEFVPVYLEYSEQWGVTASDNWYACVDGDDPVPDVAIGRLPASTRFEANWMVDKIRTYEKMSVAGTWRKKLLFIAGIGDPYKEHEPIGLYRQQTEKIIDKKIAAEYDIARVYVYKDTTLQYDPYFGGTTDLITELNSGAVLTTFIGHGGGMVWSDKGLFRLDDIYELENSDKLPVILSATCFTGAFDDPREVCLGEAMLKRRSSGAVAFWGASGLGYTYEDIPYLENLYERVLEDGKHILGDAITAAKARFYAEQSAVRRDTTGSGWSLLVQYNLLGDPALKLVLPPRDINIVPERYAVRSGDTLICAVDFGVKETGILKWAFERHDSIFSEGSLSIDAESVLVSVPIPVGLSDGDGDIVVYFTRTEESHPRLGRVAVAVGKTFGITMTHTPENVTMYDSILISANIIGQDSIHTVSCVWYRSNDTLKHIIPMLKTRLNFTTMASIPPDSSDSTIYYYVRYTDGSASPDSFSVQSYRIQIRPDISVGALAFAGIDQVVVRAAIINSNYRTGVARTRAQVMVAKDIKVCLFVNGMSQDSIVLDSLSFSNIDTVVFKYNAPSYGDSLHVTAVVGRPLDEDMSNTYNNSSSAYYTCSLFNITPLKTEYVISQDSLFYCTIPGKAIDSATVVALQSTLLPLEDQPGFSYLHPTVPNDGAAFEVQLPLGRDFADSFQVGFDLARVASVPDNPCIFFWDEIAANWIKMKTESVGQNLTASTLQQGWFGLLNNSDQTLPDIEINVEGQRFSEGSYVSDAPVLVAILQDDNGINTNAGMIELFLDGIKVSDDAFSFIRSTSANTVPVTYTTGNLSSGMHEILFKAQDCAGNSNTLSRTFVVDGALKISMPGTYPSPFSEKTEFVFMVTSKVADVSLKIYTSAGRLIRTYSDGHSYDSPASELQVGLFRIPWDGTDDKGREVANGVYFYKISVSLGTEKVTYRGKVARCR